MEYIKEDKANGEKIKVTKEQVLNLLKGSYKNPEMVLKSITKEHHLSLVFSNIYLKGEQQ